MHELDGEVNKILRRLGFFVVSLVLAELGSQVTKEAKAAGLTTHRSGRIKYSSLFSVVEMLSPYLWNKRTGCSARPVKEQLGIEHGDRSIAVQRAMSDFGAEKSFGQAAKRFEEYYRWRINRAKVRRGCSQKQLVGDRRIGANPCYVVQNSVNFRRTCNLHLIPAYQLRITHYTKWHNLRILTHQLIYDFFSYCDCERRV